MWAMRAKVNGSKIRTYWTYVSINNFERYFSEKWKHVWKIYELWSSRLSSFIVVKMKIHSKSAWVRLKTHWSLQFAKFPVAIEIETRSRINGTSWLWGGLKWITVDEEKLFCYVNGKFRFTSISELSQFNLLCMFEMNI